jgi:hypothetical protein
MAVISNSTSIFSTEPILQNQRPKILRNLHILLAILKRVKFPKDSTEFSEAVFNHIRPILPVVLELVKSVHSLVSIPSMAFLLAMSVIDKHQLLGTDAHLNQEDTTQDTQTKTIQDHVKVLLLFFFLECVMHISCTQILHFFKT